jgi:hypothetical protein
MVQSLLDAQLPVQFGELSSSNAGESLNRTSFLSALRASPYSALGWL